MEFRMSFEGNVGVCQVGESENSSNKGTRSQRRIHGWERPEWSGQWETERDELEGKAGPS